MSQLIKIADWTGLKRGNVVFVHGLGGHPYETWCRSNFPEGFWPQWLAEDVQGLSVFSFGYVSPPTNWIGTSMPLLDEAAHTLRVLLSSDDLHEGPIAFVCHSLGGLIVKQVLRSANEQRRAPEFGNFFDRVSHVVFIATPHTGAGKATLLERAGLIAWGTESARDLVANNPELRDLNFGYRELAEARRDQLRHLSYYEMVDTLLGRIVSPDSADPGLPNCRPVPIRKNHIDIAKLERRDDLIYIETKRFFSTLSPALSSYGQLRLFPLEPFKVSWSWTSLIPKVVRALAIALLAVGIWQVIPPIRTAFRAVSDTEIEVRNTLSEVAEVKRLVAALVAVSPAQAGPAQELALSATVESARDGANQGDERLKRALALLKSEKVSEAQGLFREVAEQKASEAKISGQEAAVAFRNLGAIANLRDPKGALQAYDRALEFEPEDPESLYWSGWLNLQAGNLSAAETRLVALLKIGERSDNQLALFRSHLRLGELAVERGALATALEEENAARSIALSQLKATPDDADWLRNLSASYEKIGTILDKQNNLVGSVEAYNSSLEIDNRLFRADPRNAAYRRDLSISEEKVGDALLRQQQADSAIEKYRSSLALRNDLLKSDPNNVIYQQELGVSFECIGNALRAQHKPLEALEQYKSAKSYYEKLATASDASPKVQFFLGYILEKIGLILSEEGQDVEAMENYEASVRIRDKLLESEPTNLADRFAVSNLRWRIGNLLMKQNARGEALATYESALEMFQKLSQAQPENLDFRNGLRGMRNLVETLKAKTAETGEEKQPPVTNIKAKATPSGSHSK